MMRWIVILIFLGVAFFSKAQDSSLQNLLKKYVETLAHDSMEGRLTGTQGYQKALNYIRGEMKEIGLQSFPDSSNDYLIPYTLDLKRIESIAHNVAGYIPAKDSNANIIIFSAHFDHIGKTSNKKALPYGIFTRRIKGDSIFNGANDNASGTAALLALAQYFKTQPPPVYNLLFVAFSGEELGLLGSESFVKGLNPALIKLNINLEMLGRPLNEKPYILEPDVYTAFRDNLNKNLKDSSNVYPKNYFTKDPFQNENLFKRSDHFSFYKKEIPAYTIIGSSPKDRYYHTADDEIETLDFEAMTQIVEAIRIAVTPFTQGRF